MQAGLCQQVGVVPAALAEPDAEASVPAEVGYILDIMYERDAKSQPCCT